MKYPKGIFFLYILVLALIEQFAFIGMGLYGAYHGIIKYNFDALAIGNLAFIIAIFIHFWRHWFARRITNKEENDIKNR